MKKLLFLLFVLVAQSARAALELPEIISDGMVLQQNTEVRLWGWAEPHARVTIIPSWGAECSVGSDADGRWSARIATPAGGFTPRSICFESGGKRLRVEDVLIGEVWFAGGQSNMEMPLDGFVHCPVEGANEMIARAANLRDRIRFVTVPHATALTPQERTEGRWQLFSPHSAPGCSAVACFFAEAVSDALQLPVGIVVCSWGGTPVECWLDRAALATAPGVDLTPEVLGALPENLRPTMMYNAMVHPLAGYTIRGFLWYQGESNVERYAEYAERMGALAALWRERWGQGELPFYYVEIAPFDYGHPWAPYLREAQWQASERIPNCAVVSTNDLVEPWERKNIHPRRKREVGQRLAWCALSKCYGMTGVAADHPRFRSLELRGREALVSFTHTERGFNRLTEIEGFELCGADRRFYPARARIEGFRVALDAPEVERPVAVRYCFRSFQLGNLANGRDLPVVPFRTDDYPPTR